MPDDDDADVAPATRRGAGVVARQMQRFRAMLAEAEAGAPARASAAKPAQGSGLWRAIMRRIAETIAEQRLLWHLRHQTVAQLCHPDDHGRGAARSTKSGRFHARRRRSICAG